MDIKEMEQMIEYCKKRGIDQIDLIVFEDAIRLIQSLSKRCEMLMDFLEKIGRSI